MKNMINKELDTNIYNMKSLAYEKPCLCDLIPNPGKELTLILQCFRMPEKTYMQRFRFSFGYSSQKHKFCLTSQFCIKLITTSFQSV